MNGDSAVSTLRNSVFDSPVEMVRSEPSCFGGKIRSLTRLSTATGVHLAGRRPDLPTFSVCVECKLRGTTCVVVAKGQPCLGPVTRAGCGAICPSYDRGCYGCFGPSDVVNAGSLAARFDDDDKATLREGLRGFNVAAPAFEEAVSDV